MENPCVLVLTYNRREYLERTLRSLSSLPSIGDYAVYVSQDGHDAEFDGLAASFGAKILHRDRVVRFQGQPTTAFVAQHYKHALDRVFLAANHSHTIVVEDDMTFAPDFLSLFEESAWLLREDPTLFCVSSWNDYGLRHLVSDRRRLFRTDYFPGLGWMLRRELWLELRSQFPLDHWDHWMRTDAVSRGRDCVVPEVSRNHNFGEDGTTSGSFYHEFVATAVVNKRMLAGGFGDLRYLLSGAYEQQMQRLVRKAHFLGRAEEPDALRAAMSLLESQSNARPLLITFLVENFAVISDVFRLPKSPRTQHRGTILLKYNGRVFIVADARQSEYLEERHRVRPNPATRRVASAQGESCDDACLARGLRCDPSELVFANRCSELALAFPCDAGCQGSVLGEDLPNFVVGEEKPDLARMCLTTEAYPLSCSGRHASTQRLCTCL
jgi:alpha-1,3-mannosyl-glycoprotein beta-1,2-N-acetylglucosaminyltransferase